MFIISYVKIKIILNRSVNNSILIIVVLNQITPTKGGIKNTVKTILLNMFYKQLINRYCTKLATKCYRIEKSSV